MLVLLGKMYPHALARRCGSLFPLTPPKFLAYVCYASAKFLDRLLNSKGFKGGGGSSKHKSEYLEFFRS